MKEIKSMTQKEIVLQKIWDLFNLLRSEITSDDYSVILLFIYLRSDNIISDNLLMDQSSKHTLIQLMNKVDNSKKKVFDIYVPSIEGMSEKSLNQIIGLLVSINIDWLKGNVAKLFDKTLERIALSQGRRSGEFIQPNQLTEFVNSYIGNTRGLKIFNPFAGVASFIKDSEDCSFVYAQELNRKTWAIGQLRLFVHQSVVEYKCEDSISYWPTHEKFDLIVSNPPFGLRLNQLNREKHPEFRTAEEFLLGMSINSLSIKGKSIAILSQGILFRGGSEQRLRERLIQEDLIDTIISFPGGLLYHTGIPFVVLVLNMVKDQPGKIKLVDASSYVTKTSHMQNIIEVENLLNLIKLNKDSESLRIISNKDVVANDYNLNILRYFREEIEGVKLKDILSYYRGARRNIPQRGKLIRVRDLKDDKIDFQLNVVEVEEIPLNRAGIHKVDSSCLLLAIKWKTLKPTYFHFENEPIFNGSDIMTFHVDESIADVSYLVNELQSEYVQQQLKGFRQGVAIPFIRRDDLLEVKVKLPSIEEQRAKVVGLKEISDKIKQLQSERSALAHGIKTKEFNEFASLKHTLGSPRQNILGWSKNLSKFFIREKDAISKLNTEFKELFDLGIIDAITEINRDIKFISDVLEKGENGLVLKNYDKTIVSLSEINSLINELSDYGFKFSIEKQLLKVDEMKTRGILSNKILLKTLLDNLLTNADKYGFKDKSEGNHVMIELREDENQLILDVRNNGLPFPKNFDREKFSIKYSTADNTNGSGLGGYDINRIATYFDNSDWKLILNNDPIYPVIFSFSLPIKLIN
jgi:type I restriction enzyme M protein